MARLARFELPGALYHVTARGDRREAGYFDDDDRERWLALLDSVRERVNWFVHTGFQITNHYHLRVDTPDAKLSRGMSQRNGVCHSA